MILNMRKFLVVLCMITCMLGMTACGSNEQEVEVPRNIEIYAMQSNLSSEEYIQKVTQLYFENVIAISENDLLNNYMMDVPDDLAMEGAVGNYESAIQDMGEITSIGDCEVSFSAVEAVANLAVEGTKKDADVEIVFDKDMNVTSFAVNVQYSFGELMTNAALNTLLGMGTVFAVLILICFIISGFKLISKVENALKNKASKKEIKEEAVDNTIAQIEEREELSDDLELVAVIAAAIASYEGTSTDGFVVRSIRKVNRNKWLNA